MWSEGVWLGVVSFRNAIGMDELRVCRENKQWMDGVVWVGWYVVVWVWWCGVCGGVGVVVWGVWWCGMCGGVWCVVWGVWRSRH